VVWCSGADPTFVPYSSDPRFVGLASQALGSATVVQLIQQAHFKLPGDGVDFAWHQDASNRRYGTGLWDDVNGAGSFVQLALAVDAMGPHNGGLRFIPGSQHQGFVSELGTGPKAASMPTRPSLLSWTRATW
jgi:ectoine hydroxylase-related dioxygenase (phytanoyl-CoA dioxygenase family)